MGLTEGIQKAFLATIIPPDFKATAFGVYASAVGLATLPASLIGGLLWDRVSPAATFYFGAATATLSALLFIGLIISIKEERHAESIASGFWLAHRIRDSTTTFSVHGRRCRVELLDELVASSGIVW